MRKHEENRPPVFITLLPFILASASPRRRRFLEEMGIDFEIHTADIDERRQPDERSADFVRRLAHEKAATVAESYSAAWILGADTVVVLDDRILGKPDNPEVAREMLRMMSGRWHEVWTGFCLCRKESGQSTRQAVKTAVKFIPLSEDLIQAYVATGEPLDKAGSYGIQGKGGFLVERLEGSYSNVVGLPLSDVLGSMLQLKIIAAHEG